MALPKEDVIDLIGIRVIDISALAELLDDQATTQLPVCFWSDLAC
jgi:hypothetical protein